MPSGPLTSIEQMSQKLLIRWVGKWHEAFHDPVQNNFYERVGKGFKPVLTGQRRLLTQCRQLAVYAHASTQPECKYLQADLEAHCAALQSQFQVADSGGWIFSIDDEGRPKDRSYDLYSTSFVIFALCHYWRATGDDQARTLALSTLQFIRDHFRLPGKPGFAEAVGADLQPIPAMRRQNPHMHLLEACLVAAETWGDAEFKNAAAEMVLLFDTYFFKPATNTLSEYFSDELKPHAEKGHIVEPGHYFEWIWLLKKYANTSMQPDKHTEICRTLLDWANDHGWDTRYGGIFDELSADGDVLTATKRIWPFTEALKANALMLEKDQAAENQYLKSRMAEMIGVFSERYMQERGFWTERLNEDLTPLTDFMPGTTPYHVYFGIMEAREILRARGKSKSFMPQLHACLYKSRRGLSEFVKSLRGAN